MKNNYQIEEYLLMHDFKYYSYEDHCFEMKKMGSNLIIRIFDSGIVEIYNNGNKTTHILRHSLINYLRRIIKYV